MGSLGESSEELAGSREGFDQGVYLCFCVVEVEARPCGGRNAEAAHKRLGAVMSAANGYALLVWELGEVVRVHVGQREGCNPRALLCRAMDSDPLEFQESLVGVLPEPALVLPHVLHP